jgi:hypothetical protein
MYREASAQVRATAQPALRIRFLGRDFGGAGGVGFLRSVADCVRANRRYAKIPRQANMHSQKNHREPTLRSRLASDEGKGTMAIYKRDTNAVPGKNPNSASAQSKNSKGNVLKNPGSPTLRRPRQ